MSPTATCTPCRTARVEVRQSADKNLASTARAMKSAAIILLISLSPSSRCPTRAHPDVDYRTPGHANAPRANALHCLLVTLKYLNIRALRRKASHRLLCLHKRWIVECDLKLHDLPASLPNCPYPPRLSVLPMFHWNAFAIRSRENAIGIYPPTVPQPGHCALLLHSQTRYARLIATRAH